MKTVNQLLAQIENKQFESQKLNKELSMSLTLRKAFNINSPGTVTVQKVKPSGVTFADKANHIVRILVDKKLFDTLNLVEFEGRIAQC